MAEPTLPIDVNDGDLGHEVHHERLHLWHDAMINPATGEMYTAAELGAFASIDADTTGATDTRAVFAAADALPGDKWIPAGTYKISSNLTLTGRYWFEKGAVLKPDAGIRVTISGSIVAGRYPIFDATVSTRGFFLQRSDPVLPEWFGARADWQTISDAVSGDDTLVVTSATAGFSAADVGKTMCVQNSFVSNTAMRGWTSVIASVQSATQVTLTAPAAYAGGTTYAIGAVVTDVNIRYVSIQAGNVGHTPASSPTFWAAAQDVTDATIQWWTNDGPPIRVCLNALAAGSTVDFAGRTYVVGQDGSNAWAVDTTWSTLADGTTTSGLATISSPTGRFTQDDVGAHINGTGIPANTTIVSVQSLTAATLSAVATAAGTTRNFRVGHSRITLRGIPGATWLKHPTGMPNGSVSIIRLWRGDNLTLDGIGVDGNWGHDGVTTQGAQGINHVSQVDPKNYGVFVRGTTYATLRDCRARQTYGDFVWVGESGETQASVATNTAILNFKGDMSARNGITAGSTLDGLFIHRGDLTRVHTQAFDSEPVDTYVRNVKITDTHLGRWWDTQLAAASSNLVVAIAGNVNFGPTPSEANYIRQVRIENCTIDGKVLIEQARDVMLSHNRIVMDVAAWTSAAVDIQMYCDDIKVADNWIYCASGPGAEALGAVQVRRYAVGSGSIRPANIEICRNQIHTRAGRHGVYVLGSGRPQDYNPANAYGIGNMIHYLGDVYVSRVASNIGNTPSTSPTQWLLWDNTSGDGSGGYVVIEDNLIDCANDGTGAGGHGIFVTGGAGGMRLIARRNRIKNATTNGIYFSSLSMSTTVRYLYLEVSGNLAWDDHNDTAGPTCLSTVHFQAPVWYTQLILRDNIAGEDVAAPVTGLTSGFWQVSGDMIPNFVGYGTPEGTVAAPIGARYARVDGTTNTATYRKETGTSTAGWIADT